LRKRFFILGVILLSTLAANSQAVLPDSVEKMFAGVRQDSAYIIQLNILATGYLKSSPAVSRQIASYVIETAPQLNFLRGYARGLTVMGNSYWYEGIYEFAQNYYLLAARKYKDINDSLGLAQVYNNIGEVNKRLGEPDMALEYLLRSLEMKQKDSTRAMTLYNIGELYITLGDYGKATDFITESMALAQATGNEKIIAYNHWSNARIRSEQGLYKEAFAYFYLAEKIWIKLGEIRSLIQTYQDMAYSSRSRGALHEARSYLDKAAALSSKINVPDLRITTYLEYFKTDSAAGNFGLAVHFLSRHNALKDSVYNLLKAEQIARIQAIYETEMHERENRQLRVEKELDDAKLLSRELLIGAISAGLMIAAVLAVMLFRQRKEILSANKNLQLKNEEISFQKNAIESQAEALLILNDELHDLNKLLGGRVDERTEQVNIQNKKLAEYTFTNAHKLRAPVASILGLINLLQEAAPDDQKLILNYLQTCADELDDTLREINTNLECDIVSELVKN
jgi:tetratricopeptide (TPR) repeat protein